jgi:hypothetical protein
MWPTAVPQRCGVPAEAAEWPENGLQSTDTNVSTNRALQVSRGARQVQPAHVLLRKSAGKHAEMIAEASSAASFCESKSGSHASVICVAQQAFDVYHSLSSRCFALIH